MDYSQLEPRILAHRSGDPKLIEAFNNDWDVYSVLVKYVLGLDESPDVIKEKYPDKRDVGKMIWLGLSYGMGMNKFRQEISRGLGKDISYLEAEGYYQGIFGEFEGLRDYKEKLIAICEKQGYITGMLGKHIYVPPQDVDQKVINYDTQNSASDLTCEAHMYMYKDVIRREMKSYPCILVHDEGVWLVPEKELDHFKKLADFWLVDAYKTRMKVPLKIGIEEGQNWGFK